jgi:hypothetical protein
MCWSALGQPRWTRSDTWGLHARVREWAKGGRRVTFAVCGGAALRALECAALGMLWVYAAQRRGPRGATKRMKVASPLYVYCRQEGLLGRVSLAKGEGEVCCGSAAAGKSYAHRTAAGNIVIPQAACGHGPPLEPQRLALDCHPSYCTVHYNHCPCTSLAFSLRIYIDTFLQLPATSSAATPPNLNSGIAPHLPALPPSTTPHSIST